MRIMREWMVGVSLAAIPLGLWRCSGVNSVIVIDAGSVDSTVGGGSGGDASPVNSVGSGSSSGGTGGVDEPDAGKGEDAMFGGDALIDAAPDGPLPCVGPEGGLRCTPGVVGCGGEAGVCMTDTNVCCQPNPPDGGAQGTCQPNSGSCANGEVAVQCEEAADCPSGHVCCENFPAFATLGPTTCMPSCPASMSQICRTHAECGMGDSGAPAKCVLQTCGSLGFGGLGKSVTLEACAVGSSNNGALPYCMAN